VVIGGSSGIGLEMARRAPAEGVKVILTARDADRLQRPLTSTADSNLSKVSEALPKAIVDADGY